MGEEDVEEEGPTQDRETHFVRVCAAGMHMDLRRRILEGNLEEEFRTPIPRHPFHASMRNQNANRHLKRTTFYVNLQDPCRAPIPGDPSRARLRSRNAHGHHKSHSVLKCACARRVLYANPNTAVSCKLPQPKCTWTLHKGNFFQRAGERCRMLILQHTFCPSPRFRNAHDHVTRLFFV